MRKWKTMDEEIHKYNNLNHSKRTIAKIQDIPTFSDSEVFQNKLYFPVIKEGGNCELWSYDSINNPSVELIIE